MGWSMQHDNLREVGLILFDRAAIGFNESMPNEPHRNVTVEGGRGERWNEC